MEEKNIIQIENFELEELIQSRIKANGTSGFFYIGSETQITFYSSDDDLVDNIMKNVLYIDKYEKSISPAPDKQVVKRLIGLNGNEPFAFIDDNIVKTDRIEVKFETSMIRKAIEDELGTSIPEFKVADYFEYRDGDVSKILLTVEDVDYFKDREGNKITTKSGYELYYGGIMKVSMIDNNMVKEAVREKLKELGEFELFLESGAIECGQEQIILCLHEKSPQEKVKKVIEDIFGKESDLIYFEYVEGRKDDNDFGRIINYIEEYYETAKNSFSIPADFRKNYDMVVTFYFDDICKYLNKVLDIEFDYFYFAEGSVVLFHKEVCDKVLSFDDCDDLLSF